MPRSSRTRLRRRQDVERRIASIYDDHVPNCTVPDPVTGKACGRPTARAARDGLSAFTCRYHQQFRQRHGSNWSRSPSATALKPYLSAALSFIGAHRTDPFVSAALTGMGGIMASAGPVEVATRLNGLPPEQRAKIALARLREANIKPERLLAIPLAVAALIENAPATVHRTKEFCTVAVAKAAHRLASGTHRIWPVAQPDGRTKHIIMNKYPPSSGRILRYLGAMIEAEAELTIYYHLSGVLALKAARDDGATAQPAMP